MSFSIRKADRRHLPAINRLIVAAKICDEPLEVLPGVFWFVRLDGKVVGCMGGEFIDGGKTFIGLHLAVEPSYRKRGIGMALFNHAMRHAQERKATASAFLTMYYHFNRFKRRGFRVTRRALLPEPVRTHWMFTAKRYMKCAAMVRTFPRQEARHG